MIECDKFNLNGCQITTLTQFKAHFGVGFGAILTFSYKSDQTGLIQMFCGSPLLISKLKMWCLSSYKSELNIFNQFSIISNSKGVILDEQPNLPALSAKYQIAGISRGESMILTFHELS